jgi:hypothetical protein
MRQPKEEPSGPATGCCVGIIMVFRRWSIRRDSMTVSRSVRSPVSCSRSFSVACSSSSDSGRPSTSAPPRPGDDLQVIGG